LCRNAAEFKDPLGHSCGVILESGRKGHADIIVSFEEAVSLDSRVLFLRFVDEHLRRKAKPDSLARSRVYRCPVCEEEITNDRAVATRLAKGLRDIPCQYCGEAVPLTDMLEQSFEEPRWFDQVRALDNAVAKERAKAVSEITVKAKKQVDDFDVFLAHNAQDKPQVEKIAQHLKERGLNPWLDKWNLPPGRRIAEEIERVLPNTRAVAVFIAAVGTGPWEQLEIYAALQLFVKNRRPLIPVLLPGATGTSGLPLFLQQFNIVRFDLDVHDENALDNLQWGITGQQPGRGEDGSGMVARRGFLSTTSSSFPTS
jgi:DNA-directed RNA polymerase subunit RPC12/RpoP